MVQKSLSKLKWTTLLQPWQEVDWLLLFLVVGLTLLGGIMIRSAESDLNLTDWRQHWITGGVGLVLALGIARLRYESLLTWHWVTYGLVCLLLLAVQFFGASELGAQRWLAIGGFNLQPSEFAKVAIIITTSALLSQTTAETIPAVIKTLAIVAVPWTLVFLEPNLGTSLIFGAITMGILYWANAKPGWLLLMMSPILSAICFGVLSSGWLSLIPYAWVLFLGFVAWKSMPWYRLAAFGAVAGNLAAGHLAQLFWGLLKDYQKDRIILFLNPEKDPLGGGYHLIQSRIAIGAGGLSGRGLYQGTQTQLNFIPEQWTDFIFSAIGEELGFIGGCVVLFIFWLICLRLVIIAHTARDNFGSLIAIGVLSMLIFQVSVNIGMTIGLSPVTGIPLPWLSYGRSSLLANFLAIGLVESVANHRQRNRFFS